MRKNIEINREYSENYIQPNTTSGKIPLILKKYLKRNMTVVDLGCGDGGMIYGFKRENKNLKVTGVDISPRRITHLKKDFPKYTFLCQDVCHTSIKNESQDFIYTSQVIEHVSSDQDMIAEIERIAKNGAMIYIGSVIRKPYAFYKYKNRHGKFALDPTHEREYKSQEDFKDLLVKNRLKILKIWQTPVRRNILGINIKIPRFYIVEAICKK